MPIENCDLQRRLYDYSETIEELFAHMLASIKLSTKSKLLKSVGLLSVLTYLHLIEEDLNDSHYIGHFFQY